MFYVLSLLCVQDRGRKDLVGVRFLDVDNTSIFDMDIDTLRSAHRKFSLKGYESYVDVLKPAGSQLLTDYEILNPNLGITDKSTDPYTISTLVVGGHTLNMAYRICYDRAKGDVRKLIKYYNETEGNAAKKAEAEKEKPKIVYEFDKTGVVTFYRDFGFGKTAVAICSGDKFSTIGESYFDRTAYKDIAAFESAFNTKWNTPFNMVYILGKADIEASKLLRAEQEKESLTNQGLERGKQLSPAFIKSLPWKGTKGVGAYALFKDKGYIVNLPYNKYYVFDLQADAERPIYDELKDGVLDHTWCHCGYKGTDVKYVKNYRGVSHGYICPKCNRFTQIG